MKLAKIQTNQGTTHVAVIAGETAHVLDFSRVATVASLADILHSANPQAIAKSLMTGEPPLNAADFRYLAPVDQQETWAAGVTYKRSQVARMEESEAGASHYDKVYTADRPELFFKGTPNRISHPGDPVRVRFDSQWSVPEPEFTLVLNPKMQIVGYTIGNDLSARDIEGENPLYLPQAKVYRQCCSLGPVVLLATEPLQLTETKIELTIKRNNEVVFQDATDLGQLHRKLPALAEWLGKEDEFPNGAFLLTGTGIVPHDNFTLEDGDQVTISVTGIGSLTNPVAKGTAPFQHGSDQ